MLYLAVNTYVHILMVIGVFLALISQLILVQKEIDRKTLIWIRRADTLYGVAAILVVTTGLLNWLQFGKGFEYYNGNVLFIVKFSLFIFISLLSIYPTIIFARMKKAFKKTGASQGMLVPNYSIVTMIIKIEVGVLFTIPLFATLVANGIDLPIF